MTDSEEQRGPPGPRTTLKLKTAPRPRTPVAPTAPAPQPPPRTRSAAKAVDWADEHKQRMQADMDALGAGTAATHQPVIKHR
jgi:hypothetical protein